MMHGNTKLKCLYLLHLCNCVPECESCITSWACMSWGIPLWWLCSGMWIKGNCLVHDLNMVNFTSNLIILYRGLGTAVAQWLRCYATNRKVTGSIPAGVIDIILLIALWPWGRLSLLTEMSTRSILWGSRWLVRKADNLMTILICCHEIWEP